MSTTKGLSTHRGLCDAAPENADLVRLGHRPARMADQMPIRRFCVCWHTIVIAA